MKKAISNFLFWLAGFLCLDVMTAAAAGMAAMSYNAGDYVRFGAWFATTLVCIVGFVRHMLIPSQNKRKAEGGCSCHKEH